MKTLLHRPFCLAKFVCLGGGGEGGNGAESFSLEVFILPVLHLPSTLEAGVKRDDFLNLTTRNKRKWCFLSPQFLRLL